MANGENRVLISVGRVMAARMRRFLVEGIAVVATAYLLALLWGKPQISSFRGWTMAALSVSLSLLGALFLEQLLDGGCKKRSSVHLAC